MPIRMSLNDQETQEDTALLVMLGYKQELKRQFSLFSMAANAVITTGAWVCRFSQARTDCSILILIFGTR